MPRRPRAALTNRASHDHHPRPLILTELLRNPASRLWQKDVSLWQPAPQNSPKNAPDTAASIAARLGWLHSIEWMTSRADALQEWAGQVAQSGHFERAIVLGMGGSSLAPAVFASLFAPARGGLPLQVIDTTEPDAVARAGSGDLRRCLFIVASKSGATVETADLYRFFRARLAAHCADPQSRFVIVTDEGSELHRSAESEACRKIFLNPDDVGGRYSALSYFGMLPAALLGVDLKALLRRAGAFCETTRCDAPADNPALALGLLLGGGALAGRDKLMLRLPRRLTVFGLWIEQLIAESTGKGGKGLVPVLTEIAESAENAENTENTDNTKDSADDALYGGGEERILVHIGCDPGRTPPGAGLTPHCALPFDDPRQLGAEFFRWEVATALAAACLGVNPFDQPDVVRSKERARAFVRGGEPLAGSTCRGDHYDLCWPADAPFPSHASGHPSQPSGHPAKAAIAGFCRTLTPNCYLGLLVWLPEDDAILAALHSLGTGVAGKRGIVFTLGIGPRYLHSTGQLHKGGPPAGRFLQFIADPETDVSVPRREYTFGALYRAQADGDFAALASGDGTVMRVRLKGDRLRALAAFANDFMDAV